MDVRIPGIFASLAGVLVLFAGNTIADVSLDGTVGPKGPLSGPNYDIPHTVGKINGGNLFHSFDRFSLEGGENATFTADGLSLSNVISRVTGKQRSDINGTLRSTVSGASFWFINPNGMVFGPEAKIDVPAAFHVSTADYVGFADGTRFSARNPSETMLTAATPEAFGFVGTPPAALKVEGTAEKRLALNFARGSAVSFVGGDLEIKDADFWQREGPRLANDVRLVSVAGPGEVRFTETGVDVPHEVALGNVRVSNSEMELVGNGGGRLLIRSGELTMGNVLANLQNSGQDDPERPSVDIQVARTADLRHATLNANSGSEGNAGDVTVRARTMTITGGRISTVATGSGDSESGIIQITADRLTIADGAELSTLTETDGAGGELSLKAGVIELRAGADIEADSREGRGPAGRIAIEATESLAASGANITSETDNGSAGHIRLAGPVIRLTDRAVVSVTTQSEGARGTIDIDAPGRLTLASKSGILAFNKGDPALKSNAGNIVIRAGSVTVQDGFISTLTQTAGDGGNIHITASDIRLSHADIEADSREGRGPAGRIAIEATESLAASGANITSETDNGSAGHIRLAGPVIQLTDRAVVSVTTQSEGARGTIDIDAPGRLTLASESGILAFNKGDPALKSNAGNIVIRAGSVTIQDGMISTLTQTAGDGGNITVIAGEIRLLPGATIKAGSEPPSAGRAGTIRLVASGELAMQGATVDTFTHDGEGGSIEVTASDLGMTGGALMDTSTNQAGAAGSISVNASQSINVQGSETRIISNTYGDSEAAGSGGVVRVNAPAIAVTTGGRIATVSEGAAPAGAVIVSADELVLNDGTISSASRRAGGGQIDIQAGQLIHFKDSAITTAVAGGSGDAGDIAIDPRFLVLDNSRIVADAEAGRGGNISIRAGTIVRDPDSVISASSRLGVSGSIFVSSPEPDIASAVATAPPELLDPASLIAETCPGRSGQPRSSLVRGSRGGLPDDPSRPLAPTLVADRMPEAVGSDRAIGESGRGSSLPWREEGRERARRDACR